jgi:hypothetical protein
MDQHTGRYIILAGILIIIIGIIIYFFHDRLHWIGRLPGDIRVEKEHFRFYFPITTMILASMILTLMIYLIRKL